MMLRTRLVAPALAAAFAALPLSAPAEPSEAARLVMSMEAVLGVPIDGPDRETIGAEVAAARAAKPEHMAEFLPVIESMAALARGAEHPATRVVMEDLHRQLVENLFPDPDRTRVVAILDARNRLIAEIYMGVGLSQRDLSAAAYLETLARDLPGDPTKPRVVPDEVRAVADRLRRVFAAETPANQQFIARLDAWAAGVLAAWPRLTPEQRRIVAQVTFVDELPPPDLIEAVTGSNDLLAWLGAMDLALSPAERAAHPELMAFLGRGKMTAGVTELLARRLAGGAGIGGGTGGVTAMQNLNYELLWDDLSGDSVVGRMLGLE